MEFVHVPVLLQETLESLAVRPDGIYVDGTVGGAGHSYEIASRLTQGGQLIGLDRDPDAVKAATDRLQGLPAKVVHCNYSQMRKALDDLGITAVDGILMDLGVSSHQLDEADRGFSYHADAPLDMRMSQTGVSAQDVVNTWSEGELTRILRDYGEEKFAGRIAANIVRARETEPIVRTGQLADIIRDSVPQKFRRDKNPCKKSFQAIRIAVNDEFGHLREGLEAAFACLKPGGRLAVITFHSLEDRIVKQQFAKWCSGCTCPPDFPQCVCGKKPEGSLVVRKPVTAGEEELSQNHRSRSAKLRVIERSRL
ncbi:MAG: 16S rRNA (cytosine(1402)-N(4))-methyltransferase RsmH [Oscillospiraceae bacterium]|nr:16S rRNA (cytosine(1402)-N(4))-methyltransferase RsmH [Oscillospiraceae bacterium]MBR4101973.1 16S rRNA (cytosine(1402)-N(4))-methyltransferase RsmH [Oscillospiraceae bacterium]MBR6618091.1 16S rRNA (cytosine(1402)-N(4))-methyltransferase RsmH [Oscillospiraceae bacterium]